MQQKVTPPVIIVSVVVLTLLIFGLYKLTLGKGNSNVIAKAENAPAYAKQMQQNPGVAAGGAPSGQAASYGQSYAEGAKYRNSYSGSGPRGSAPQMGGNMGNYSGGSMGGGR